MNLPLRQLKSIHSQYLPLFQHHLFIEGGEGRNRARSLQKFSGFGTDLALPRYVE